MPYNKNPKFTPQQAAPRDAFTTRPLAGRYMYNLEGAVYVGL